MEVIKSALPSVIITGASTGIGSASAHYLAERGYQVFAGVRKPTDAEHLLAQDKSGSITPIFIDVTDSAMIAEAAQHVQEIVGQRGVNGLINNAGIAVMSPLEIIPLEDLRKQIEVNLIGQVAVTQAFLPMLRQAKGRIINMSSISGTVAFPLMGAYAASKWGLEAVTDALRQEVYPWGIRVISLQPGTIQTPIWEKGIHDATQRLVRFSAEGYALYQAPIQVMQARFEYSDRTGLPVEKISALIYHILTVKNPRTRYLIAKRGWQIRLLPYIPDRWRDEVLRRVIGLPGRV
jgi:NAD(P)-dependent dehydrogenase (short-subunit alcohol dehydrogenase family)